MTADLPDWDRDPPRHAALDARVREVLLHAVHERPAYLATLRLLYEDCADNGLMPELLVAFGRVFCATAIACQGRELTAARLEGDIEHSREIALWEAQ